MSRNEDVMAETAIAARGLNELDRGDDRNEDEERLMRSE